MAVAVRHAAFAIAMLLLIVCAVVAIDYVVDADEYHFGTEVHSWRYRSARHYVGVLSVEAALLLLSCGLGLHRLGRTWQWPLIGLALASMFLL